MGARPKSSCSSKAEVDAKELVDGETKLRLLRETWWDTCPFGGMVGECTGVAALCLSSKLFLTAVLETLLSDAVSGYTKLARLPGLVELSEVGEEAAPTLRLNFEYKPLMPPLTKSFVPEPLPPLPLPSKSLNEVRASDREAVVCISSRACARVSLSIWLVDRREEREPRRERKPDRSWAEEVEGVLRS